MNNVVILDFGSQYTQLIARAVRSAGVYCEIHPFSTPLSEIKKKNPKAIILSGGPESVGGKKAPKLMKSFLEWNLPVLGICYGMQLLTQMKKGKVSSGGSREYGEAELKVLKPSGIFKGFQKDEKTTVWMSHGDSVETLPKEAELLARSGKVVAGFKMGNFYGIQFHPEVSHTKKGRDVLSNFLFEVAKLKADWKMNDFFKEKSKEILEMVGERDHVLGAVSGGVDSTLLAVFMSKILGKRFHPVMVDTGLLRENEAKEVAAFLKTLGVKLKVVKAHDKFMKRLEKTTDPEKKRKIIGKTFIDIFDKETKNLKKVKFLAQGTLYPDVIESVSVKGPSHTIKTHHNVGGLPKRMKLKLIEPFRELFKDEVRALGKTLKVPAPILNRHPFPGPGLAVRILGKVSKKRVHLLQRADSIFIEELRKQKLYEDIWQAFAVLLPVKAVGVMGDARTYESVIALRAVTSLDGMTADWFPFEKQALGRAANRIINEVPGINRVVYDISSKPPATIEWE